MNTTLILQIWECDSELTKLLTLNKVVVTLSRRRCFLRFFLVEGEELRTYSQFTIYRVVNVTQVTLNKFNVTLL